MSEVDIKSVLRIANSQLLLRHVLQELHQQEHLQLDQLVRIYQDIQRDINVPLTIFAGKRNPAEALCLFLKEHKKLTNQKIAEVLSRDSRSIWGTYQRAKKRNKNNNNLQNHQVSEKYSIPLQLFSNRSLSLLEHIILYLHQVHQLTNPQIAKLLERSPNSIAVLYKRAREKKKE